MNIMRHHCSATTRNQRGRNRNSATGLRDGADQRRDEEPTTCAAAKDSTVTNRPCHKTHPPPSERARGRTAAQNTSG